MEDTWANRDLPVLTYLVQQLDDPDTYWVEAASIPVALGLSERDVKAALTALGSADPVYIEGNDVAEFRHYVRITGVTERARRAVGAWPTAEGLADSLLAALDRAADAEPDPAKKSRIKQVSGLLGGALRDVAVEVAGAALARSAAV